MNHPTRREIARQTCCLLAACCCPALLSACGDGYVTGPPQAPQALSGVTIDDTAITISLAAVPELAKVDGYFVVRRAQVIVLHPATLL